MSMPSDASLLLEKPLLQILSNIVAGIHPPNPTGPSSVFEHFTRTRYSGTIRPEALKEWHGQNHIQSIHALDTKESDSEPSLVFYNRVSRRLFEALSDQELAQLTEEYNEEWTSAKKRYERVMKTMYGQPNIEQIMDDIPDVLGMILTALETLTNNHLILWAGGASKQGFGLINVTCDISKNEKPAYIPGARKTFFEQMARQAMSAHQDVFISKCVSTLALLPSNLFLKTTHKRELIDKVKPTNAESGASLLSPTTSPLTDSGDGDEHMTSIPSSPVECISFSVHPSTGNSGGNSSNILVDNEGEHTSPVQKRMRTSGTLSSPVPSTSAKKPRFAPTPLLPTPSTLPRRSSRNPATFRSLSMGRASHMATMSPLLRVGQIRSSWNTLGTDTLRQVPNERSVMPPPGLLTRSKSRNMSLPPIRCLGQLEAARRARVPIPPFPLSTPPASSAVRLKNKGRPLVIPANCPAPLQALIETIPKSASWLPRALSSILAVDVGPKYHHLIMSLIELEVLHKFTCRWRGLSSAGRPEVLSKWINSGRRRSEKSCVVADVGAYANRWWKWWRTLQPKWRAFDQAGVPVSVVEPESADAWNYLLVPGPNGLLGVVASLYWWGCSVLRLKGKQRKEEEDGWIRAIEDCAWVMECLARVMRETTTDVALELLQGGKDGQGEDGDDESEGEGDGKENEDQLQELE